MTKAPIPTEMSKGQSSNTNNATKSSIKQQLRTDLGRSVGVTTATQLVWLTGLRAHLPTPRNSRKVHSGSMVSSLGNVASIEGVNVFTHTPILSCKLWERYTS